MALVFPIYPEDTRNLTREWKNKKEYSEYDFWVATTTLE